MSLGSIVIQATWTPPAYSGYFIQAAAGGIAFLEPNQPLGPVVLDEDGMAELTTLQFYDDEATVLATELLEGQLAVASDTLRMRVGDGSTTGGLAIAPGFMPVESLVVPNDESTVAVPLSYWGKWIRVSGGDSGEADIEWFIDDSGDTVPVDAEMVIEQLGTLPLRVETGAAVPPPGKQPLSAGIGSIVTIKKIDADTFHISGHLEDE